MPEQASSPDDALAVIVLAAGAGTRMRSATPKVLHTLAGRSMLAHALHAAAGASPAHLVTVLGHQAEAVSAEAQRVGAQLGTPVTGVVQPSQDGTGHAVAHGLEGLPADFAGTVVVTAGDVPLLDAATLRALVAEHRATAAAVSLLTTTLADPTGYGRIIRDADGAVVGIVEQSDADEGQRAIREVNSGVYAFDAPFLRGALGRLDSDNAQGEIYLTDTVSAARAAGLGVGATHVDDAHLVAGVNDRVQLSSLSAELNRRIVEEWMRAGVTVVDPATTHIDVGVRLAPDVTVHPGVQLHGATVVDEGAAVGPDTTLTDVEVGAGATVIRTHGTGARIAPGASVGPFAYLRPGTVLGAGGKIGAFCETKNADIGVASKVPHLTYVGDATIGEHTNIGASCVFVNYDGLEKHHTTVGSYVRAGSDTMFVAPLTIGDGAYTAAGTVVRKDVPPGALAMTVGAQRNLEGWVERRWPQTASADAARLAQKQQDDHEDGGDQ
ncbi:bifunctional UDP-N-acetylglucosamine diphosphorylase/glucosamine-1-phosphate N-acetyltransferase GlmU [Tomitella gaofuii]|uniref:bifunctional UDP-N-acetylglucosamine diphosphorylase/glucosamine-1-phosphate N-acetyltransferase GlmU n=1 Tax=Tomitella gaofuii TaxID=2760083 RepID=UPI0015FBDF9A|nr:bifunctional UDP-N-acetylglucosamine diphosphorylase/glucosamine-1-phosphate N-acetyltransferase GlmU [Tomitella gaofuii]